MKHILVVADPVNEEQFAFQKALHLAKLTVADIHVAVFCFESFSDIQDDNNKKQSHVDLKEIVIDHTKKRWENYIGSQAVDVKFSCEIVWEKYIHNWILKHCKENHYDLIVKTGHRSETFFYTATDWQLFRESSVPIYCISQPDFKAKKVILVALDLTAKSKEKRELNESLLETAFRLAIQTNSELHCCYAIEIPTLVKDMDLIDVNERVKRLKKIVKSEAEGWLDLYDMDEEKLHIKEGKAYQVVNYFSQKLKAQCVVLGSVGRTGVSGKLIGNTAEKVIHRTKSDLIVI